GECLSLLSSSRRRHTRFPRDWSSDVCSSDLSLRASGVDLPVERTDFDAGVLDGVELVAWSPGLSIETGPSGVLHAQAQQRELPRSEERRVGQEGPARAVPGAHRTMRRQGMDM